MTTYVADGGLLKDLARGASDPAAARRAAAFAAARRHSALVYRLRRWLPFAAVSPIVAFLVIGIFDPFSHIVNGVSVESIGIDGTKVTMAKPKLSGFRKDGRAYTVTADKALQDLKAPTLVQLIAVHADLGTPSDGDVTLTGREGLYDTAKEHMDITGDVRIHSARYDVKMEEASVQFKGGRYETHHPITIVLSDGSTIRADEAVAVDNGHELTFSGHVRTVMQPQPQAAQAEAKGEMRSGEQ